MGEPLLHKTRRAFFFAPIVDSPDRTPYPHAVIALAEGLKPLGIGFYADRPYWQISPDSPETLFQYDDAVEPEECDIIFFDRGVMVWRKELDPHAMRVRAPKALMVLVDHNDLARHALQQSASLYADFDFILKSHAYQGMHLAANCTPWPFGFVLRQLHESEPQKDFDTRQNVLRVNFRHTAHSHAVRLYVGKRFLPLLGSALPVDTRFPAAVEEGPYGDLMWRQTGRRHMSSYFEDMRDVKASATFGGWFIPNLPSLPLRAFWPGFKALRRSGLRSRRIAQWDSWRLWEAMICGAVAVHVDFDKYGMKLPEIPQNWIHYIGVDLGRPRDVVDRLVAEPEILRTISIAGREWAIRNYSPDAVARRFLALIGDPTSGSSLPKPGRSVSLDDTDKRGI